MTHIHMLVFGEFVPQAHLQKLWSQALGEHAQVWVTAVSGSGGVASAIREALKYAMKGEKGSREQARHSASVEVAFRGVKRISVGGALRQVRVSQSDGAADDGLPEDLHDRQVLTCRICGSTGEWEWIGAVPPEAVVANGGFGFYMPKALRN